MEQAVPICPKLICECICTVYRYSVFEKVLEIGPTTTKQGIRVIT